MIMRIAIPLSCSFFLASTTSAFTVSPHGVLSTTSRVSVARQAIPEDTAAAAAATAGLYRPFVEYAWSKLEEAGVLLETSESTAVPSELAKNEAVAKGMPEGTTVKISIDAKKGNGNPVTYGRFALLETLLPDVTGVSTKGIQVMNLVVFGKPPLPVWGVDLVSLPGDRHLLAMDVQPMTADKKLPMEDKWKEWHDTYVTGSFEWGGDLPEDAQKFFSPHGLWTRLAGEDAVPQIQTDVFAAFAAHLDLYLECVAAAAAADDDTPACEDNHQDEYLQYRLQNDPARPMLQRLYGPEWTERVLEEVLFPKDQVLSS
jgi:phycoerythrobilin:ferredoxin oxidoreductase